jgi:hypothetical protein
MGDVGDQAAATLPKLRQRFDRFGEICNEVGRDPKTMRRAYLVGWSDDRPFESDQALREFVQAFADVGVTDFMFALSSARPSLEQTAASLESLRAVASA